MTSRRLLLVLAALPLLAGPARADGPSAYQMQPRGWIDILPGPRLKGWTRIPIQSQLRKDVEVWTVDRAEEVLSCRADLPAAAGDGKGGSHEVLRYARPLGDFMFHVEWRFADPGHPGWTAGVRARVSADGAVWHQAQLGGGAGGFWVGDVKGDGGKITRQTLTPTKQLVLPAGQWNVYEITAIGDKLSLWVNGEVTSVWEGIKVKRGYIGLEGDLHRVEFRNLRLKELPKGTPAP